MSTIHTLEDLEIWQLAMTLSLKVEDICKQPSISKDTDLCNNLKSSATAVHRLIEEGFRKHENREFIHYLSESHGSCAQLKLLLHAAFDKRFISREIYLQCIPVLTSIDRKTVALVQYLEHSNIQGRRY